MGWNDTIRKFNVSLGIFELGNVIYFEAYNIYYGEIYNETVGNYHTVIIYNSVPRLTLFPRTGAYVNHVDVRFAFDIFLYRGNITEILMDFGDGSPIVNLTLLEKEEDAHGPGLPIEPEDEQQEMDGCQPGLLEGISKEES